MNEIAKAKEAVFEFLKKVPLNARTIKTYQSCYKAIEKFCKDSGISKFTKDDAEAFCDSQALRCDIGEIKPERIVRFRRAAILLADQMNGTELVWKHNVNLKNRLSNNYIEVLSRFTTSLPLSLAPSTSRSILLYTRQFLEFVESSEKKDINGLTAEDVQKFIISKAPKCKRSMSKLTWALKKFIAFLKNDANVIINANRYLTPAPIHKRLLPCLTKEQTDEILSTVDTATPLGKRDYAILSVALGTGLRGVDIISLKLTDIDWRKNEIIVTQSKTGTQNQLPLLLDVSNAIADYILNARPQIDSPYIFLRHVSPYKELSNKGTTMAKIFSRYLDKTNIPHNAWDGTTFHAIRRSVGTRLVKAEIPLPTVAQILGHKRIDSTKRYIALNDDALRVCCLDISDYATSKEGLN